MAMEKPPYLPPQGLSPSDIEVIVDLSAMDEEDVFATPTDDGGMEILIGDVADPEDPLLGAEFGANLADYMDEEDLLHLGQEILTYVDMDISNRKDWVDNYVEGMEVLGLKWQVQTDPWPGASGAFSSLLMEAVTRFQAETMMETFPAAGPVRTKILGEETPEKMEAAKRVEVDMNHELLEVMTEYRTEHEKMLFTVGLGGTAFKKVYFDPSLGRQTARYLPPEDVVAPYSASVIDQAERITHIMRLTKNEMHKLQKGGFYTNVSLGDPEPFHTDIEEKRAEIAGYELNEDDRFTLFEVCVDWSIEGLDDEEGLDENRAIGVPYVITIEKSKGVVIGIRRNWDEGDPLKRRRQHFVKYGYMPGLGFYDIGLIQLVGGYSRAGSAILRELIDAGQLANLQGGFKTAGMRVEGDNTPIGAGEWKDVDVPAGTIRDNILPLPYKEPSATLLALLDKLMEEGRRLGSISDLSVSDMSANAPVGTTLALLERTLKSMSAVQARMHYAMKQEFKLLHKLIAKHAPEEYGYAPDRAEPRARQSDYATVEVIPVSDPNSSTMAQRVVQYQAVHQLSATAPQIYNLPHLHRQMIEVLGVKNAEKLVPTEDDVKPVDPVSENMNVLMGKPLKAFLNQDHRAHLAAHSAFMQDPMVMQSIGQNPMAKQMMGALQAHMAEHMAYNYRKQMEEKMGAPLPLPDKELPAELEIELSRMMAQAGQQLSQRHKQEAAQAEAKQKMQDPVFQQKEKELAIKGKEVERKARKDEMDKDIKEKEIAVDLIKDKGGKEAQSVENERNRRAQKEQQNTKLVAEVQKEVLRSALQPKTPPNSGGSE